MSSELKYQIVKSSSAAKIIVKLLKEEVFDNIPKELLIAETKDILDRIMNAASHHSENPLHREELKRAIAKMIELKEHLREE